MRRKKQDITDAESPDFATCEHCGEAIGWDDYSYTHMSNGFATCGTILTGGRTPGNQPSIEGFIGWVMRSLGLTGTIDPVITQDPRFQGKTAEPTTWYEEAA